MGGAGRTRPLRLARITALTRSFLQANLLTKVSRQVESQSLLLVQLQSVILVPQLFMLVDVMIDPD
jgi:hypothetical protein